MNPKDQWDFEDYKALIRAGYPTYDSNFGGHFELDEDTTAAIYDFMVSLFGKDGKYSKENWVACSGFFYKYVDPVITGNGGKEEEEKS